MPTMLEWVFGVIPRSRPPFISSSLLNQFEMPSTSISNTGYIARVCFVDSLECKHFEVHLSSVCLAEILLRSD